jgi:hypothetical protein
MTEKFKDYIEHAKMIYQAQPNAWTSAAYRATLRLESLYADAEDGLEEAKALMNAAMETYEFAQAEKAKHTWQPIETAPEDGTRILAYDGETIKIVVRYPNIKEWGNPQEWGDDGSWAPTHWMALPEPPEAPATEEDNNE